MTGEEFRRKIGGKDAYTITNSKVTWNSAEYQKNFNQIKKKLRVLARATDEDKLLIVEGIQ